MVFSFAILITYIQNDIIILFKRPYILLHFLPNISLIFMFHLFLPSSLLNVIRQVQNADCRLKNADCKKYYWCYAVITKNTMASKLRVRNVDTKWKTTVFRFKQNPNRTTLIEKLLQLLIYNIPNMITNITNSI